MIPLINQRSKKREHKGQDIVILVGQYPPPYGGVSVHIQRLVELLHGRGLKSVVLRANPGRKKSHHVMSPRSVHRWFPLLIRCNCVVHVHVSELDLKNAGRIAAITTLAAIMGNKTLVTFHSTSGTEINNSSVLRKILLSKAVGSAFHCIAVAPTVVKNLEKLGIASEKLSMIPAFLPPIQRVKDYEEIPREIRDFMTNRVPVITANAYDIDRYNGEDLYGIDMCIDLCANLRREYPALGLVFCISHATKNLDYLTMLQQRIREWGLQDNFLFVLHSYSFYVFISLSDLFLRPTNTDGDAISVREALYLKVPTIASDSVPRPDGVIEFANRDVNDLTAKAKDTLNNYARHKTRLSALEPKDNFEQIFSIYSRIFGGT